MGILDVEGGPRLLVYKQFELMNCPADQAENADEWSYQKGLEGGWIPMDPSDRLYPGLCSGNGTGD